MTLHPFLRFKPLNRSSLRSGEVRVSVLATPIHPSNLLKIAGQYGIAPNLPETPGTEGVGEVVEIGSDVQKLSVGQRVFHCWLQYLATRGGWTRRIVYTIASSRGYSTTVDVDDQSDYMLCAYSMDLSTLKEGDWVIQNAANSAVGTYLIQIAKERGIRTLNIVRRQSAVARLEELGATHVLVDGPDLVEQVRKVTNGEPIRLGIDAVGGKAFSKMVETLSFRGYTGLLWVDVDGATDVAIIK